MKKLLTLIILAAGMAYGQTYNVAITNSLLGPVNLDFTGTVIQATGSTVITGAVVNATVTNSFSPSTFITNEVSVGATTVINSNTFITTNLITQGTVNITNITQYTGTFTQNITTQNVSQFNNVNAFTPTIGSTNVTGTWTISLNTNNVVAQYTQTGNITSVVFSVTSTNDVALGEVLFRATTNSLTWPTNKLTWAAGSAPTLTTGQWSIILFHAWRDDVHGVYVGDSP